MAVDTVIIGAGPAGIAAALQLKRSGLKPALLEQDRPGGLLLNAQLVENYPGFPAGISGPKLVARFNSQLRNSGVAIVREKALQLDHDGQNFLVTTNKQKFSCRFAVLASGTLAKPVTGLKIPKAAKARVYTQVHPLADLRGKTVAIVGAGDAAFDYALTLASANKVLLFNRNQRKKCLPLLYRRMQHSANIDYIKDAKLTKVRTDKQGLALDFQLSRKKFIQPVDYLLLAIGRQPQLSYLTPRLRRQMGQLKKKKLLFVAGDAGRGIFRQTAIAVGDGISAAMQIYQANEGK